MSNVPVVMIDGGQWMAVQERAYQTYFFFLSFGNLGTLDRSNGGGFGPASMVWFNGGIVSKVAGKCG